MQKNRVYKPATSPQQVPNYVLEDARSIRPFVNLSIPDMLAKAWEYWRSSPEVVQRVEVGRQLAMSMAVDPDTLADPPPLPAQRPAEASVPELSFQQWKDLGKPKNPDGTADLRLER